MYPSIDDVVAGAGATAVASPSVDDNNSLNLRNNLEGLGDNIGAKVHQLIIIMHQMSQLIFGVPWMLLGVEPPHLVLHYCGR